MIVRTPASLGAVIRDRRRQLGLEQHALASKVGVSRHWIIDAEKGRPGSEIGLVLRTLRTLGIELNAQTEPPKSASRSPTHVDLDAIIEAARKPRK